eukprot:6270096-Amphidinium_carterae.1
MTCKFFLSDDGCKKGRHCEAKHTPAKGKGCRKCGSLKHSSHECEYGKQLGKKPKTRTRRSLPSPKPMKP